ncbi:mitochondrial import inner membrane translocase subunit Tim29 [Megalops cyprinoides]|uniref:mitochondrial import inner membrane translocase subunit Tim29 n=1 Tax=Megalops cyprinoides TaxID=118141 RepID=UPI001864341B|nr:mitochondrial import inner membrane translocase subunit Tim29 [Megalops cyprinoides]
MAARCVLRRWCSTAAQSKGTRWERLQNKRIVVWCRSLLGDYKEACREVVVGSWERPFKASAYIGLLGGLWACYYTNPDDTSFETSLLEAANQLGLLSPWIRNGTSDGHVQSLVRLRNEGRLRYASLGVASLAYRADYDPAVTLYEARCSFLSVPWRELPDRVLDVGFAGRWWVLDAKMKDYDVNEEEFQRLPPALAATAPPSAQETEKNERLHEESWKPLIMSQEVIDQAESESAGQDTQTQTDVQTETKGTVVTE